MSQIVIIKSHNAGMGSNFNSLLLCLEHMDKSIYDPLPIVEWYMDSYSTIAGKNIWDKYFSISTTQYNAVDHTKPPIILCGMGFDNNRRDYRTCLNNIFCKYIIVKPIISDAIDTIFSNVTSCDILIGVHLRNTDRCIEPQYASPGIEYVIQRTLYLIDNVITHDTVCIYISSDNIPDVHTFKLALTSNSTKAIRFYEDPHAVRSPDSRSVHGDLDSGLDVPSDDKALSILTDIFALARCQYIVRTCSNVTAASGIINANSQIFDVSKEHGRFTEEWLTS